MLDRPRDSRSRGSRSLPHTSTHVQRISPRTAYDAWGASASVTFRTLWCPGIDRRRSPRRQRLCGPPGPDRPSWRGDRVRGGRLAVAWRRESSALPVSTGFSASNPRHCGIHAQAGAHHRRHSRPGRSDGTVLPARPGSSTNCTIGRERRLPTPPVRIRSRLTGVTPTSSPRRHRRPLRRTDRAPR